MNLFGFEVTRTKQQPMPVPVYGAGQGFWGTILEPFAGAWQRNITAESRSNLLAFSAVYACISIRAEDVAKLRLRLMEQDERTGIWSEVRSNNPFAAVLQRPNDFQTRQQFIVQWLVYKLMHGNSYAIKERDARGIVRRLYLLDPRYVTPKVAVDGSVFYGLRQDDLNGVPRETTVPASEIIHDRCITPFHPLIGVSPIYACGSAATQGIRIQANSEAFFANQSRPAGQLTAPGVITNETAARLKAEFEKNFSGGNIGRLLVTGDGLKYEPIGVPAVDAQLIEQLKWTVEDVARAYRVPLHKIAGGPPPTFNNIGSLNQDYYGQTLQPDIEAIEALLDEGLNLRNVEGKIYGTEFDLDGLLRTDPVSQMQALKEGVAGSILSPNEARLRLNQPPAEGGGEPLSQQQYYPLSALKALHERELASPAAPAAAPALPPPAEPAANATEDAAKAFCDRLLKNIAALEVADV